MQSPFAEPANPVFGHDAIEGHVMGLPRDVREFLACVCQANQQWWRWLLMAESATITIIEAPAIAEPSALIIESQDRQQNQ